MGPAGGAAAPPVAGSTPEERRAFIDRSHPCLSDCDLCGLCAAFHGQEPRDAFADYIDGRLEYLEVARRLRR
ncbi:hypothetical protein [Olsenella massiliensis]|uniref:hypothetical protein n=1 Tax=Olsenella massiliensis TaxID=1622075 RepID=UPI00071C6DBE|nr:hypothetical protein [Olsenella massiliensis]